MTIQQRELYTCHISKLFSPEKRKYNRLVNRTHTVRMRNTPVSVLEALLSPAGSTLSS
jgi:hypothetical protein